MSRFFINRPIVGIVISIVMTIVGVVALIQLPISQYPNIVPPEIQVRANYTGADAQTIEPEQPPLLLSRPSRSGELQPPIDFSRCRLQNSKSRMPATRAPQILVLPRRRRLRGRHDTPKER
jgi:hypothetical protein